MSRWPTIKSIADNGVKFNFFSTPGKAFTVITATFLCSFILSLTMISDYLIKPFSIFLSLLISISTSTALHKFIIRCEDFKKIRVIDIQPGMILCTENLMGGLIGEGHVVLSRLNVTDQSPQVEIVLAGRQEPLIYAPTAIAQVISPLDDIPSDLNELPLNLIQALEKYDINILNDDSMKLARSLGLVKKMNYTKRDKWTESATSYSNALFYQQNESSQHIIPNIRIYGDINLNHNNNIFHIDDLEIDIDDAIQKISKLVSTETEKRYLEIIKEANLGKDPDSMVDGFLGLGRDIIVGALGSAFWAALSGM